MKEIGTVISTLQGPNSSEFSFVINEDSQKIPVRKNEYVQLKTEQGLMIARVAEIYRMNRYYMRAESVREYERSGRDLSEMFPADKWEFLVASAIPLGIFEDGKQLRVSFPPSPGEKVYRADEKILFEFLGLDEKGLAIGKMEAHDLEVKLNLTKLFQKHLAILGISGSGKSHLSSHLIEEILDKQDNIKPAIIVFDPHGEYIGFGDDVNYATKTKVYGKDKISIAASKISASLMNELIPQISSVQRRELSPIIKKLQDEKKAYDFEELIQAVENSEINPKTKAALASWLSDLASTELFSKVDSPPIEEVAKIGQLSVFDLSDFIHLKERQIILTYFARKLFDARRQGKIPPFIIFVEESHQFCPQEEEAASAISRNIIEQIAREGRKFGACLVLITQRPIRLATTALSQCVTADTYITMNPAEQVKIKELENSWPEENVLTFDTQNLSLVSSPISNYLKVNPKQYKKKVFSIFTKETKRNVKVTEDHPFWVKNKGWVNANELKIGDKVAVLPQVEPLKDQTKEFVIVDEKKIEKIDPCIVNKNILIDKFKKLNLLPLSTNNKKLPILARLLGHVFGDGTLHSPYKNKNGYYYLKITFSGKVEDLNVIKKDIEKLGFDASQKIMTEDKISSCEFQKYGKKIINGKTTYFKTGIKGLWVLLWALGAPIGDKSKSEVNIPEWLFRAPKLIKREFLASLMGSEAQKIRIDRKSAKEIKIPFSKTENLEKNGEMFCNQLSNLLEEFKIKTSIRKRPYVIHKNGTKTIQFTLCIKPSRKNILNFCKNIGYRYCKDREIRSRLILEYFQIIDHELKEKSILWKKLRKMPNHSLSDLCKKLGVSKDEVKSLLRTKSLKNLRLACNSIPTFNEWVKEATDQLNDGLVWETVSKIKEIKASDVRDITVPIYHTFFANGFLTHNCNTHIIMRINNPYDIKHIGESSEGVTKDVLDMLPGLKVGEALITGEAVNYPLLVKVRERKSKKSEKGRKLEEEIAKFLEDEIKKNEDLKAFR